jgi:hypothetical protein
VSYDSSAVDFWFLATYSITHKMNRYLERKESELELDIYELSGHYMSKNTTYSVFSLHVPPWPQFLR